MVETKDLEILSLSRELQLILAMLRMSNCPGQSEAAIQIIKEGIDWSHFLHLVNFHRVYPSIRTHIQTLDCDLIPLEVISEINQLCARNTLQMLYLSAELDRINQIFENSRLRALLLKGPALAYALHGDIAFRNSKDLDILVPLEDFERAEAILLQSGYVLAGEGPRILSEWKIKRRNETYYHPEKRIQIELHWRLYANLGKEPSFDELWSRKDTLMYSQFPVYSLGREDLFYYLVIHGAKHAWFRLRWLLDIDRMIDLGFNWKETKNLFKKYYCEHLAGQAFILTSEMFKSKVTEEMKRVMEGKHPQRLARKALFFIKASLPESPSKEFNRYWYHLLSNHHKWAYVKRLIYPSFLDAQTLPLPKTLHFLYFPLRPFLWFWRRIKQPEAN